MLVIKADVRPALKEDEEIDVAKLNTFDILVRARYLHFRCLLIAPILTSDCQGIIWKKTTWSKRYAT